VPCERWREGPSEREAKKKKMKEGLVGRRTTTVTLSVRMTPLPRQNAIVPSPSGVVRICVRRASVLLHVGSSLSWSRTNTILEERVADQLGSGRGRLLADCVDVGVVEVMAAMIIIIIIIIIITRIRTRAKTRADQSIDQFIQSSQTDGQQASRQDETTESSPQSLRGVRLEDGVEATWIFE
jgi:hypothetical protein